MVRSQILFRELSPTKPNRHAVKSLFMFAFALLSCLWRTKLNNNCYDHDTNNNDSTKYPEVIKKVCEINKIQNLAADENTDEFVCAEQKLPNHAGLFIIFTLFFF
uniref:Uncharacterized protein n=1 Tax=Salix viminalis TaxID=40686 RepID=A0A6N2MQB3_SALVM